VTVYRAAATAGAVLVSACVGSRTPSHPVLRLEAPARVCAERATSFFGGTALEDREAWYSSQLRAAKEGALCRLPDDTGSVYRFTWIPSFNPTVVVRVESGANGYRITAKSLSGAGGYEPGSLAHMTTYELDDADMEKFAELLTAARFWELPTDPPPDGTEGADGAQWVLEGLENGRYHVVDRWSPRPDGPDAAYRRLGEWLLTRSSLAPSSLVKEY